MTGEAGAKRAGDGAAGGGLLGGCWERPGQALGQNHMPGTGPLLLLYQVWEGNSRKKEVGNG